MTRPASGYASVQATLPASLCPSAKPATTGSDDEADGGQDDDDTRLSCLALGRLPVSLEARKAVWVLARTMSCLDSAAGQEVVVAVVEIRFPGFGAGGVVSGSGGRQNGL